MKRFLKPSFLPLITLICGVLTCLMRLWLFTIGKDDWGLLPVGIFPDVMCWILVAVTMAVLALGVQPLRGTTKYIQNFPASLPAAIGTVLAALGFCISSLVDLSASSEITNVCGAIMGFLAAGSLLALAYGRYKGLHPNMLFHGIVCVYLMIYLVSHYRLWSSCPQVQSYGFELLSIVFVMVACYQRLAFDAGKGNRRAYTFFSLATLFFCIATLPSCDNPAFFIGSAAWMYFTPCRLRISVPKED